MLHTRTATRTTAFTLTAIALVGSAHASATFESRRLDLNRDGFIDAVDAQMIRAARQVVAVADSSKLLRRSLSVIARVEQIHTLITDQGASADSIAALRARGVDVVLV